MVFGSEGFARVESIAEKTMLGRSMVCVELFVIDANMRTTLPVERAIERGLRPISSTDELDAGLEALPEGRYQSIAWNRDGRLVKDHYAHGQLEAMFDTIGSLLEVAAVKKLNDAQRTLLDRARRALTMEIATAFAIEQDEANERLEGVIGARV